MESKWESRVHIKQCHVLFWLEDKYTKTQRVEILRVKPCFPLEKSWFDIRALWELLIFFFIIFFCSPLSIPYFSLKAASRVAVDILPLDVERLWRRTRKSLDDIRGFKKRKLILNLIFTSRVFIRTTHVVVDRTASAVMMMRYFD